MSWISPTFSDFGESECSKQPPKKKIKASSPQRPESPVFEPCVSSFNWLDKYKPKTVDELAVNAKKVNEVEAWLGQVGNDLTAASKFLLLTGPSGCGKSTTIQVVSKSLGFKVIEWITPLDKLLEDTDFRSKQGFSESAAKRFQEFLFRSSRYGSCLVSTNLRKLVLIKDIPNVFIHNPTTFHDTLESFIEMCRNPVVFVFSDETLSRKLFPATLKSKCQICTISFNAITDQRMFKVLKTMIGKESKINKSLKVLSDETLHTICSVCGGDIRSAISKLHFCSINSNYDMEQLKSKRLPKKGKSRDKTVTTDKDTRLDFFRGVGRVLYPKTVDHEKELRFVHSTQTIVDNFLSEPNSFISQLHENYPDKLGNVYDLSDAAKRLSQSDILMARWQEKDVFQMYALSVAVQGVMVSNKAPKKGRFEAFRKSGTSRTEIDSKAIELEDLDAGQLEYLRRTCQFK